MRGQQDPLQQKKATPGHPQTQGKTERLHEIPERSLAQHPAAAGIAELRDRLDAFRLAYIEQRPHKATGRIHPGEAYRATSMTLPAGSGGRGHFRLGDVTDTRGAITLRRAGRATTSTLVRHQPAG